MMPCCDKVCDKVCIRFVRTSVCLFVRPFLYLSIHPLNLSSVFIRLTEDSLPPPHQNELISAFRAEQKCDTFFKNVASSRRALRQWAGTRYGGVSVRNITVDVSACETDLCNDRIPGEEKKSGVAPKRESQD